MSLRQVVITNLAIAHVNGIQLNHDRRVAPAKKSMDLVAWDLCKHDIGVPNLGGKGPAGGPEEMRLSEITKANGQPLDLVVSVHEDSKAGYKANTPTNNRVENCFGYTNVAAGSKVKLNFKFTKPGEASAWDPGSYVPHFKFTMLDLDESKKLKEEVVFNTPYDHLYLNESQPRDWHYAPDEVPRRFWSKSHGVGLDNPDNASHLSPLQQSRSFQVRYSGKTEWDVSFNTILEPGKKAKGGRNFMWAGASDVPDAQACEEWDDATFAWGLCDSEITTNNLGGFGPDPASDDNAEEIRYSKVGSFNGRDLDLVVEADDNYKAYNISRNVLDYKGPRKEASIHGCYGAINVKSDTTVTLDFSFQDHETGDVLTLGSDDGFGFTVYDIDRDPHTGAEELVNFITPYAHGDDGAIHGEQVKNEGGRTFRALSNGTGKDNIYEEPEADEDAQKAKAVRVMYQGRAHWKVQLTAHGGLEGRNFLFSGCSTMKEE